MILIWLTKFLFNNYTVDIFLFVTAVIPLVVKEWLCIYYANMQN